MAGGHREVEVKIPLADPAGVRRRMRALGLRVSRARRRESNWIWDAGGRLRAADKLLRLRQAGDAWTLTFKGPRRPGPFKSRREIEIELEEGAVARELLEQLGFQPQLRYDRFRTQFRHSAGELDWDETPMGIFLELEGPASWIRRTLTQLALRLEDAEPRSYPALYLAWQRKKRRRHAGRGSE